MSNYTLGDFFDAMEKNGYPKIKAQYISEDEDGAVIGACAMGQAALNMNVSPTALSVATSRLLVNDILSGSDIRYLPARIYQLNDNTDKTVAEIAQEIRQEYKDYLDRPISVQEVVDIT